jgi:hypothetical protein
MDYGKHVPRQRAQNSHTLQTTVETYTSHVIDRLIGIKGRDRSDVAAFILRSWVSEHREEIAGYGISVTVKDGRIDLG